jgi:hypothetical protein
MQTTDWFSVDKEGLAAILERRGKAWAVLELIQNALDTASPVVDVMLTSVPGAPYAVLTVADTDPDGFKDLAHAYTLFAPSQRAGDAEKRGRFNKRRQLFEAQDDVDRKRAELIEEIERQLQTKTSIKPVFTLRWTLGDGAGTTA